MHTTTAWSISINEQLTEERLTELAADYTTAFSNSEWGQHERWDETKALSTLKKKTGPRQAVTLMGILGTSPIGLCIGVPVVYSGRNDDISTLGPTDRLFYVSEVFICEIFQGQGFARQLIRVLIGIAKDEGFDYLIARIDSRVKKSQRFFERLGFKLWAEQLTSNTTAGDKSKRLVYRLGL